MSEHHAPTSEEAIAARKAAVAGHTESHGHSRAAWAGVAVVILGAMIASFATVFAVVWLVIVGLAVMAVGGPVGMLLSRLGYGAQTGQGGDGEKKVIS